MSRWLSTNLNIDVKITNLPKNNKYSLVDPVVEGIFTIDFLHEVKNICSVKYGIVGNAHVLIHPRDIEHGYLQLTTINGRNIAKSYKFFDNSNELPLDEKHQNIDDEKSMKTFSFGTNEKLKFNFDVEFPTSIYLPSTCDYIGDINGDLTIQYDLYVEVYKYGGILTSKPKSYGSFKIPIKFQSGMVSQFPKYISNIKYIKLEQYKNKVKKFYFDKEKNALIPTSLNKSHSKTKFLRQIWNSDFKSENYNTMTKSIPLSLGMISKSYLDLMQPIKDQIFLDFECDLKSVGIDSNQSTDFVFNDQSTNLGLFFIDSLLIELQYKTNIKCYEYIMTTYDLQNIFEVNFNNLSFDIKDFEYDKLKGLYKYKISNELFEKTADMDLNRSLMDILGDKTVMCSGKISNWFENISSFKYTWKVSDGMYQKKRFVFKTSIMPDFMMGYVMEQSDDYDSNSFVPPPAYVEDI